MIEIPLRNGAEYANHQFIVTLGDNQILIKQEFLSYLDTPQWVISVYRESLPVVLSKPLVPNVEITSQSKIGIGRIVFVGNEATLDNLGVDNKLIWAYE